LQRKNALSTLISPKLIVISDYDGSNSVEFKTYRESDIYLQSVAKTIEEPSLIYKILVVFDNVFVWTSHIILNVGDADAECFLQRAMQAEWEFNAGVRPAWWPAGSESDRMWGVHYREDQENGRAIEARARLKTYDLRPVVLNILPSSQPVPASAEMSDPQRPYFAPSR